MARLVLPSIERIPGGRAFAALSRRVRALIVAGVLFLVLFILVLTLPVPYVILSPGPTCNTLGTGDEASCRESAGSPIIVIKGRTTNKVTGHLNLTTVSESGGSVTAFQAFIAWLKHDETVVPYSSVHPPGTSDEQTNEQNAADFSESQDNATVAAACELKYPKKFGVVGVTYRGPSDGVLDPGDVLLTLDGKTATTTEALQAALAPTKPKQKVTVAVTRAGKPVSVTVTLGATLAGHTGGSLGISPGTVCAMPFSVDLGLGNRIGGPSAGLMFALGIMAKVGSLNLTDGHFVAGTGTIDATGRVGAIGGIALKMIAARNAGATVFLAPAGNCGDVRGNIPSGLQVVKVSTLSGAVADLQRIETKQSVPSC